jgi:hypothetical protein
MAAQPLNHLAGTRRVLCPSHPSLPPSLHSLPWRLDVVWALGGRAPFGPALSCRNRPPAVTRLSTASHRFNTLRGARSLGSVSLIAVRVLNPSCPINQPNRLQSNFVTAGATSHWLLGVQLIALYVLLSLAYYFK